MFRSIRLTAVAASIAVVVGAAPALGSTLSTPLTGGNYASGIMFDINTGAQGLTLTSIEADIGGQNGDFLFYTIAGGIGSHIADAAAWTLRDTFTDVAATNGTSANGTGVLQTLDITDLDLAANSTYGLYIMSAVVSDFPHTSLIRYTNLALGNTVASNADLSVQSGYGMLSLFGDNRAGRAFNGSLNYTIGAAAPEPASWAMLVLGFGGLGAALRTARRWRCAT